MKVRKLYLLIIIFMMVVVPAISADVIKVNNNDTNIKELSRFDRFRVISSLSTGNEDNPASAGYLSG